LTVFISCSFDPETRKIADFVQSILRQNQIDVFISGQAEAKSLPESIRSQIRGSEALLTIITPRHSAWVQNEIGIAYEARKPVYAIVQKGVETGGILPHITVYQTFDPDDQSTLVDAIEGIAGKIFESRRKATGALIVGGLIFLALLGLASGEEEDDLNCSF